MPQEPWSQKRVHARYPRDSQCERWWLSSALNKKKQFVRHCRDKFMVPNICLSLSSVPHSTPNLSLFLLLLPLPLVLSVPVPLSVVPCPLVSTCSTPHSPPRCCLAPASAAKFPEAVLAAGLTPETPLEILALEKKETRCTPMRKSDDWTLILRNTIEEIGRQWTGHVLNASN